MNKDLLIGLLIFCIGLTIKFFPAIDIALLTFFNKFLFNETFYSYFTELGSGWIAVALIFPLMSFISHKSKKMVYVPVQALIISGIYIGILVQLMKEQIFPFTRPAMEAIDGITYLEPIFKYSTFPSGHAATIFGSILIWFKLGASTTENRSKNLLYFLAISVAVFIALSRVIIAAHWFSDILASLGFVLIFRSALTLNFFKNHLVESKTGKFFSYFLIAVAWIGIIFFDISEYF